MYRRYYRYNDPAPGMRRTAQPPAPTPPAPEPEPQPQPQTTPFPFSLEKFLGDTAKDDLILVGILLLILLGEEKEEIDLPLVLALLYLLLRK